MRKPLQIGITGGIGSGKSLVCRIFKVLGVSVYDADSRAKAVMTTDGILVSQIKKEFGELSYVKGELNRTFLAEKVFNDEEKLTRMNELVHPRVKLDYDNWYHQHVQEAYVIKEAALLYEATSYTVLDKIIVVYAPEEMRIQRVVKRDLHRTEEQIKNIIHNQMSDEEKRERADFVVLNDESSLVIPQVLQLHGLFTAMAQHAG